jgi:cell division protein FtsL
MKEKSDESNLMVGMFFVIIILLMIVIALQVVYRKDTQKEIQKIEMKIDSTMQHRSHLDTLYWNHLERCAFEERVKP